MGGADEPLVLASVFVSVMTSRRRAEGVWETPSALVWEAGCTPGSRGVQCSTYKEACWLASPGLEKQMNGCVGEPGREGVGPSSQGRGWAAS